MIVKVGGSVADRLDEVVPLLKAANAVIVPGGWIFADLVRKVYAETDLDDDAAHWMAIAAMSVYGHFIASKGLEVIEPDDFGEIPKRTCVLLPYRLLRRYDELPHSWDVTSDSIAAWIAAKLGEKIVIKVTAASGIKVEDKTLARVPASKLRSVGSDVVDAYLPEVLLRFGIDFLVLGVDDLKDYILHGKAGGTLIEGR